MVKRIAEREMNRASYVHILRGAESLSRAEQLRLISETSILTLQGLGKEIWQRMDAQDYVNRERASWNG